MNKEKLGKVGGQAVIEGVMMQSQDYKAVAVRKSNGEIEVKKEKIKSWVKDKKIDKIPFLSEPVHPSSFARSFILAINVL